MLFRSALFHMASIIKQRRFMTVKELITKLSKMNPTLPVYVENGVFCGEATLTAIERGHIICGEFDNTDTSIPQSKVVTIR